MRDAGKEKQTSRRNMTQNNQGNQRTEAQSGPKIRGNYRLDAQGNPIIPPRREPIGSEELDSLDYFSRKEKQDNHVRTVEANHSHYGEIAVNRDAWLAKQPSRTASRSQAPLSINNPDARSKHSKYDASHDTYLQSKQPERSANIPLYKSVNVSQAPHSNYNSRQNSSWYYRMQQGLSTNKGATLPQGKSKLLAVFLILYGLMLVMGWQLLPYNKVNQIIVSGTHYVPVEYIEASSRIYSFDSLREVKDQQEAIEDKIIEENPLVESVTFRRVGLTGFELAVKEHDLVGIVQLNGGSHPVLSNGVIIDASSNQQLATIAQESLPNLVGFTTSGELNQVAVGLRQIEPDILVMMESIENKETSVKPKAIEVKMKDGNIIKAISSTLSQKVQHYPEILSQLNGQKGIINFEVGAYFTPNVANANSVKLNTD